MIRLSLDEKAVPYEQDIRELVKAFYPGEDFEIRTPAGVHLSETTQEEKNALKLAVERQEAVEVNRKSTKHSSRQFAALSPEGIADESSIRLSLEIAGVDMPLTGVRKSDKSIIKSEIYETLCDLTGRKLPWGDLTGIRPVSLVSPAIRAAAAANAGTVPPEAVRAIRGALRKEYRIEGEKLDLMMEIGLREHRILRRIEEQTGRDYTEGFSLYVGIPFCPTRCLYCSFTSNPIAGWSSELQHYLDCLRKEIRFTVGEMCGRFGKRLQTIYIGGGTPTALPEEWLGRLMELLHEECDFTDVCEFTVEAGRPDSITREKLRILKDAGVSRVSVNPQTFSQKTLDLIGRRHTVEQVKAAYFLAREMGFDNINMDIILGLPGEKLPEATHTLCEIARLKPESLTVHSLAIKRAARLTREKDYWDGVYRAGEDLPEMYRMMRASEYTAALLSLKPYYLYRQKNMAGNLENVGYAAEGRECLYNILMMEEKHTVAGCGAGCSTKLVIPAENRVERCDNGKDIRNYMTSIEEMIGRKRKLFKENEAALCTGAGKAADN